MGVMKRMRGQRSGKTALKRLVRQAAIASGKVGFVPANPFMRRAVAQVQTTVQEAFIQDLIVQMERYWKKVAKQVSKETAGKLTVVS